MMSAKKRVVPVTPFMNRLECRFVPCSTYYDVRCALRGSFDRSAPLLIDSLLGFQEYLCAPETIDCPCSIAFPQPCGGVPSLTQIFVVRDGSGHHFETKRTWKVANVRCHNKFSISLRVPIRILLSTMDREHSSYCVLFVASQTSSSDIER